MNITLPVHPSPSPRNRDSRDYYTKNNTARASTNSPSAAEAINGPVREPAKDTSAGGDRLIVGVDFGTTFSG
ncbi:hypothetical protein QBC44DRAFT_373340, partial [Cladorrhinum sp. PSN332]